MQLVASSLSAKGLFDGFYKGVCGPRAQHFYGNSMKTKIHFIYSGGPNLLATHGYTDSGTLNSSYRISDPLIHT